MLEFCEEVFQIAKPFALPPNNLAEQIGGLYLLYCLYHKMPVANIKIRVTLKDWRHFIELHTILKEREYFDASYVFVNLVYEDAFQHCLFETEVSL